MERWPNFFIVGAEKAGTSSLYNYLKQCPHIFMPGIKEPNFFCNLKDMDPLSFFQITDKSKYLQLFQNAKYDDVIGEASPLYLWDPTSATTIREFVPNAKIIISLRDPVQRAYSHYLMNSHGIEKESFHNAIHRTIKMNNYNLTKRYLDEGLYYVQVKRFFNIFEKKQIKIIIFEEWIKDIKGTIFELLKFLGVNQSVPENLGLIHNQFSTPRLKIFKTIAGNSFLRKYARTILPSSSLKILENLLFSKTKKRPDMLPEDTVFLEKYFSQDIKKLENLIEKKLPWTSANI